MNSYFFRTVHVVAYAALIFSMGCSTKRADVIDPNYQVLECARVEISQDPLIEVNGQMPNFWWELFEDCQLSAFIEMALERNPTIQEVHARILLAEANANQIRADLYPYVWFGADVSRQKLSKTGVVPFGTQSIPNPDARIPVYFTLTEFNFNLKHDFDLWGKNRNTLRSALSEVEAQAADAAFARLQLSVAVARVYFQLQVDYKRAQNWQNEVDNLTKNRDLIACRIQGNVDSAFTYNQAEYELSVAQQNLLQVQQDIAVNEVQLRTYLAGNFDEPICEVCEGSLPKVPFPCALPMHLLSNRPDIAAQLWVMKSAGYLIDVAKAAFYPDFNITALFGFQTIHIHELLRWDSSYFNVDPAVTLPLFDSGYRMATLRKNEFNYDVAVFEYNNLVLNAVKEVLEGIAVLQNFEKQWHETSGQKMFQQNNLQIIECRVANAIAYQADIITAKRNYYAAFDDDMIAYGNTLQAILSLIQALGGGFEV